MPLGIGPSRLGTFCDIPGSSPDGRREPTDVMPVNSDMMGCRSPEGPRLERVAAATARDLESAPTFSIPVLASFRLRWMGGALGSRGFLGRRVFGASLALPSFGLTEEPGLRPGFCRGRPSLVRRTLSPSTIPQSMVAPDGLAVVLVIAWVVWEPALGALTTISPIFGIPVRGCRDGDPGSEMDRDGGDESSGELYSPPPGIVDMVG